MDRRKFLSRLGLGAVGAVVGAKVAIELAKEEPVRVINVVDLSKLPNIRGGSISQIEKQRDFLVYTDKEQMDSFHKLLSKHTEEDTLITSMSRNTHLITNEQISWKPIKLKYHG